MKRNKLLKILSVPLLVSATTTPLIALSGCGNAAMDSLAKLVTETAINKFYEMVAIPHVTYIKTNSKCPGVDDNDFSVEMRNYFRNEIVAKTFGEQYAEEHFREDDHNCYYDIPPTEGCDMRPKLIMQAHMDMMWATKEGTEAAGWDDPWHNKYNIPLVIDNVNGHKALHTTGYITNNGADDGQGLALIAALTCLHDKFRHGPIRIILTDLEEIGAVGIKKLDNEVVGGFENVLNLDGNMLGDITFSTAGAIWGDFNSNTIDTETTTVNDYWHIELTGGLGGHSGIDMHNNRENALYSLIYYLYQINLNWGSGIKAWVKLINIKHNEEETSGAIPSSASVDFIVSNPDVKASQVADKWKEIRNELSNRYNDQMQAVIEYRHEPVSKCVSVEDSSAIISLILEMDYGIKKQIKDLGVATSRNVTASLNLDAGANEKQLHVDAMARSCYDSDLDTIENDYVHSFNRTTKFVPLERVEHQRVIPWNQDDTELKTWYREACEKSGFAPHDVMVHGGAECSEFYVKNPSANIICIGSTLLGEHTVDETLYLDDYEQYIKSILYLLEHISNVNPPIVANKEQ